MCTDMIDLKKAKTRIKELEEELKATREDYEEEIEVLVEKNDDLIKKIGIFMGGPTPVEEDEEPKEICRGFVMEDVLVKGLSRGAIATG